MRTLLSIEELQTRLALLPGWAVEGRELVKSFAFSTYLGGIEFVNRLAQEAEAMDHHPDLWVGWRTVIVRLTTHSAGGITDLDPRLASVCERLSGAGGQ